MKTFKTALATLLTLSTALSFGCDTGDDGDRARADEFRELPPSLKLQSTTSTFKKRGCDNPLDDIDPWGGGPFTDVVEYGAKLQAEANLIANFLANEENAAMCEAACAEFDLGWEGGATVEGMDAEFGELEILGECPYGTLETSMDVHAVGEVGCACAG